MSAAKKIKKFIDKVRVRYLLCMQPLRYESIAARLRKKEKINVGFYAIYPSIWKYDELYRLMEKSDRFNPFIVICPAVHMGEEHMMTNLRASYEQFSSKGYKVVSSYDEKTKTFLDVKKMLSLDVVFYTNPYNGLIHDKYYITNTTDALTCYVPYNFGNSCDYKMFSNQPLHNLVWKLYLETDEHKEYAVDHARNHGANVVVSGYPGIDPLIRKNVSSYPWKLSDTSLKRIIWAPHHTVNPAGTVHYSCFMMYADLMLELAEKYKDSIQIAFKPHPLLRVKLNDIWGKERTDEYFRKWEELPNGIYTEGEYIDLFLTSDAMIHDSGSFLIEYLYTCRPVMRTSNGEDLTRMLNPFALDCLKMYRQAESSEDIENFIIDVINGKDDLAQERQAFLEERLLPPNGRTASQNIFDDLLKSLS